MYFSLWQVSLALQVDGLVSFLLQYRFCALCLNVGTWKSDITSPCLHLDVHCHLYYYRLDYNEESCASSASMITFTVFQLKEFKKYWSIFFRLKILIVSLLNFQKWVAHTSISITLCAYVKGMVLKFQPFNDFF